MITKTKKSVGRISEVVKVRWSEMPFRHDAGIFTPNGVSRRTLNGMKALNPR
jgi:hypothetical protein